MQRSDASHLILRDQVLKRDRVLRPEALARALPVRDMPARACCTKARLTFESRAQRAPTAEAVDDSRAS